MHFHSKNLKGFPWIKPHFIILLLTKTQLRLPEHKSSVYITLDIQSIYHENQSNFLLVFSTCSWHTSQMETGNVLWYVTFSPLLVYSTLLVFSPIYVCSWIIYKQRDDLKQEASTLKNVNMLLGVFHLYLFPFDFPFIYISI